MIASLRGKCVHVGVDYLILETGGVGLKVSTTPAMAANARLQDNLHLHTVMVVREDAMMLFGFSDIAEREVFAKLRSVSGIGPRLALALLSVHSPANLAAAVAAENLAALTKVPGVGKKTAERILVELRGALDGFLSVASPTIASDNHESYAQVEQALIGLGWKPAQAQQAVRNLAIRTDLVDAPLADLLKAALQELHA